jgi:hypothetical protein
LTLQAAPFSLQLGDSVYATVSATNVYGESSVSSAGNGALILQVPSAPTDLAYTPSETDAYQIGITWSDGSSTGGSPILDYRVSSDQSNGVYSVLASGVTNKYFITQASLTAGATYRFKVEARNSVGYSLPSAEFAVLAA